MNTKMRHDDSDLDDAIRKSLGDIIASGQSGQAASAPAAGLTDRFSGRRWLASAAAVVLVVAGLGLISTRNSDSPAPADQPSDTAPVSSLPDSANGPGDLNPDGLKNPVGTVFGGLVDPVLPDGYELVFASDDPEPLVVALNAGGDRFEAVIYSSESRLAEVERTRDELQLAVPEGVLAVGPDGQPGERNAYLVTDDAIVATDYTRIADPSTIEMGSAVDIARAIARKLPAELATGGPVAVGTGLSNDVTAAVVPLAERVQESGGNVRSTRAPTVEVTADFASSNGTETATVRIEMFDGFSAPAFLEARMNSDRIHPQVARIGTWLVIVTVDGTVSEDSTAFEAVDAVSKVLTGTSNADSSTPSQSAPTAIDWSNPPAATTFDEPDEFTRLWDLVLQGEIGQCMTAAGFEYRRSPAPDSPSTALDEWQSWADRQAETGGWTTQKAQCADAFVMSDWYGEVNSLNYIGQATNQWAGNISAIYQRPDMIEATRAIVECAENADIEITADPTTNAKDAYEEVWAAFSVQVQNAMDNIADNDLSGIEQMDQFRLDRAAAIESVCPSFSASERVFWNARREDETAWLQVHPDVAQRVINEWADDIIRLRAILEAQPS